MEFQKNQTEHNLAPPQQEQHLGRIALGSALADSAGAYPVMAADQVLQDSHFDEAGSYNRYISAMHEKGVDTSAANLALNSKGLRLGPNAKIVRS